MEVHQLCDATIYTLSICQSTDKYNLQDSKLIGEDNMYQ